MSLRSGLIAAAPLILMPLLAGPPPPSFAANQAMQMQMQMQTCLSAFLR